MSDSPVANAPSPPKTVNPFKDFLAGGFGGMCLVISGHPLDTIKVRLQTMPEPAAGQTALYRGTLDCAVKTVRHEGFLGLYKGMVAPLIGVAPMFAVCFFGYGVGKRIFHSDTSKPITLPETFMAGCVAGVFTTPIMTPGERIKCLLQVQAANKGAAVKYHGPGDCAKQLLRTGGVSSLFRGTGATLLRDVPGSGVYFYVYEYIKRALAPAGSSANELGPLRTLAAGGLSGMACWVWNIAPDVLKSRLQTAPDGTYPRGIRSVFVRIWREESIRSLYRGLTPIMLRAFPANACCFFGYELAIRALDWVFPNF